MAGFVKQQRSQETFDLTHDPFAYTLLGIIALRANWTSSVNIAGLGPGEAMLGDYRSYGMTRQEYRGAMKRLEKGQFATFRGTNKGTVAKLCDNRVYDINVGGEQPSGQPTSNQQATNKQPTSNH